MRACETERRACVIPVTHVFVCAHSCVCVRACARLWGQKESNLQTPKSWRGFILSLTLSLFFCGLVLFSGFCDDDDDKKKKKEMYICLLHIMYVSEVQNI